MRDYVEIGATPCDEDCAQVGSADFRERATRESNAYLKQLVRIFGEPPEGASLRVKWFNHDFGSYPEVVCYYESDDSDEATSESAKYAYNMENNAPQNWDAQAKRELAKKHNIPGMRIADVLGIDIDESAIADEFGFEDCGL